MKRHSITNLGIEIFKDRILWVATKHQKEQVIAPVLSDALALKNVLNVDIDTDQFGTFSGEVERTLTPIEAAKAKCLEATKLGHIDLVIASEGSFGPHPSLPFAAANEEVLVLYDHQHQLQWVGKALSTQTNFAAKKLNKLSDVLDFANKAKFPSHALILKDKKDTPNFTKKAISTWASLIDTASILLETYGQLYLETDMRACYNPSRRMVIAEAAKNLLHKLQHSCGSCGLPGFGLTQLLRGLPCSDCGTPTRLAKQQVLGCNFCSHTEIHDIPQHPKMADPMYCDVCNP